MPALATPHRRWLLLVPILGLVLAYAGPLAGDRLYARDLLHYVYPMLRVFKAAVEAGELPLWNPYLNAGVPLAGQGDGVLYPPTLMFVLGAPPAVLPWFLLVHHVVALLGAYALLRALGRSRGAATIGAAAFALSGTLVSNHMQLRLLVGAAWMPVVLAGLEHALLRAGTRRGLGSAAGGAACAGAALALMILGGGLETAYLAGLLVALRAGFAVLAARGGRVPCAGRTSALLVTIALVGLGGGAVALAPIVETTLGSSRAGGTGSEAGARAFHPARLVTLAAPGVLGEVYPENDFPPALIGPDGERPWHPTIYAGAAIVGLAALGLRRAWRRAPAVVVLGALALLLSTGDLSPLGGVLRAALPGLGMFRSAEKWFMGVALALPVLAAFGADALRGSPPATQRRAGLAAAAGGALVVLAAGLRSVHDLGPLDAAGMARLGLAAVALPVVAWTIASAPRRRSLAIALGIVVLDLAVNAQRHLYTLPDGADVPVPWAATMIAARLDDPHEARLVRMPIEGPTPLPQGVGDGAPEKSLHACETLASNACVPWCENACGFLPGISRRYQALWAKARTQPRPGPFLDLLGVRFAVIPHLGPRLARERTPSGVLFADDPTRGVALLERPTYRARARLFERVVVCPDDAAALALLPGSTDGPETLGVVAPDLPPGPLALAGAGEPAAVARACRVVEHGLGGLRVEVEGERGGALLVAESWAPGWTATVDGAPADVLPAWGALRAVLVPPGRHVVAMAYEPASFRLGLALSSFTLLGVAAGLALARRAAG